jgi:hypothetical protein
MKQEHDDILGYQRLKSNIIIHFLKPLMMSRGRYSGCTPPSETILCPFNLPIWYIHTQWKELKRSPSTPAPPP